MITGKFKVGDKVVPHAKTRGNIGDADWQALLTTKVERPYLIVKSINRTCDWYVLVPSTYSWGSYYAEEDLELFVDEELDAFTRMRLALQGG